MTAQAKGERGLIGIRFVMSGQRSHWFKGLRMIAGQPLEQGGNDVAFEATGELWRIERFDLSADRVEQPLLGRRRRVAEVESRSLTASGKRHRTGGQKYPPGYPASHHSSPFFKPALFAPPV